MPEAALKLTAVRLLKNLLITAIVIASLVLLWAFVFALLSDDRLLGLGIVMSVVALHSTGQSVRLTYRVWTADLSCHRSLWRRLFWPLPTKNP